MPTSRPAHQFVLSFALLSLVAVFAAYGSEPSPPDAARTRSVITTMLTTFLTPAVNNSAAGHERFWADDLVYTSSAGKITSKGDILKSFAEAAKPDGNNPVKPGPVFTAEDILVRPYGNVAALTFRLVKRDPDGTVTYYRNSGTFLLRDGKWQAISWQATRVADSN